MGMLAQIAFDPQTDEQRRLPRRALQLEVAGESSAIVRNLSQLGLLIETPKVLEVGDRVAVELTKGVPAEAHVIWARTPFYGCEFARPVSRAAVSAALLRSPIEEPPIPLLGPAVAGWDYSGEAEPVRRGHMGEVLVMLAVLAAAIGCLVFALASLPTV
jgi:hypothetical protein